MESNSEFDETFISTKFTEYYNRHTKLVSVPTTPKSIFLLFIAFPNTLCALQFSGSYLKTCDQVDKDYASCSSRLRFLIYFKLLEETEMACKHAIETASEIQDDKYIDKLKELMRLAEEEKTHETLKS